MRKDIYQNSSPTIKGEIGYYGLTDWWLSEFSENERNHILLIYNPMGSGKDILIKSNIDWTNLTSVRFLSILAGWFDNKRDRYLAIRILEKVEELISNDTLILDVHLFNQQKIGSHYSNRLTDPSSLGKSIQACVEQIEIAPFVAKIFKKKFKDKFMPYHVGYTQLAIIKKKEKKYQEVIDICSKAKNEGWSGDWANRIEWSKEKLNQQNGHLINK